MTGKTHVICGTITMAAVTVASFSGLDIDGHTYLPAIGLLSVAAGSYMPDIDLHSSKMGHKCKMVSKLLTHRGMTHTMLFPVLIHLAMLYLAAAEVPVLPELLLGFNIGWVVHIIADMFNKKGVPILWPASSSRIHVAEVLTASWQEGVFIFLWFGVNLLCVIFLS